jgi:small subunit ribosomal protein S6
LAANVYEGLFIFDSNRYGRDPQAVSGQIPQMVAEVGGEVLVSRLWEERRLAYPIAGHRKGTYWLAYFRMDGKHLKTLERQCRLSESILRVLFLKVDPRIVDALVAHALGGPTTRAAEPSPVEEAVKVDAVGLDDE